MRPVSHRQRRGGGGRRVGHAAQWDLTAGGGRAGVMDNAAPPAAARAGTRCVGSGPERRGRRRGSSVGGGGGVRATKWWGCAGGRWRRRARARGRRADGGAPGCATHAPPEMTGRCSGGAAAGLAERSRCRRRGRQRELRRAFTPGRQPRRLNCGAGPPSVEGRAAAQNRRARGWKWGVRETLGGASVRTCITSAARATPKDCAQGTWHGSGLLRPSPGLAKT